MWGYRGKIFVHNFPIHATCLYAVDARRLCLSTLLGDKKAKTPEGPVRIYLETIFCFCVSATVLRENNLYELGMLRCLLLSPFLKQALKSLILKWSTAAFFEKERVVLCGLERFFQLKYIYFLYRLPRKKSLNIGSCTLCVPVIWRWRCLSRHVILVPLSHALPFQYQRAGIAAQLG